MEEREYLNICYNIDTGKIYAWRVSSDALSGSYLYKERDGTNALEVCGLNVDDLKNRAKCLLYCYEGRNAELAFNDINSWGTFEELEALWDK